MTGDLTLLGKTRPVGDDVRLRFGLEAVKESGWL